MIRLITPLHIGKGRGVGLLLFLFCPLFSFAQYNIDRVLTAGRAALYYEDYVLSIQYFNQAISAKPSSTICDIPYWLMSCWPSWASASSPACSTAACGSRATCSPRGAYSAGGAPPRSAPFPLKSACRMQAWQQSSPEHSSPTRRISPSTRKQPSALCRAPSAAPTIPSAEQSSPASTPTWIRRKQCKGKGKS